MLVVESSRQFKKDLKKARKQGKDLLKVKVVVDLLADNQLLPRKYKPHALTGNWHGYLECHIEPDWLLIYKDNVEAVYLARLGSHSELFK